MANIIYGAIALTGGTAGALDALDGAILNDGDGALVLSEGRAYFYKLDADSGQAENVPYVIAPDFNTGTKRWILQRSALDGEGLTTGNLIANGGTIPEVDVNGQLPLPFAQTPILVDGQDLMYRTFYVNAVTGSDSNPGTGAAPFATIKKAVDSVPSGGQGKIIIVGDYAGSDGDITVSNKAIEMSVQGTLTINWDLYPGSSDYSSPLLCFVLSHGACIQFIVDSNTNGKISINADNTGKPIAEHRRGMVNFGDSFSSCSFNVTARVDNYNPIRIDSGVLVNTNTWTDNTAVPPCIEISGHFAGTGREIVVDTAQGAGLVYLKDVSWFRYKYAGGLANASGASLTIKDVIKGSALKLNTAGYYKLPSGLIIQWGESPSISPGDTAIITFPITFPNAVLNAQATNKGAGEDTSVGIYDLTTSNVTLSVPSSDSASRTYYWMAIGY